MVLQQSVEPCHDATRRRGEQGQASVEYALVLLGAAIIATLLISWATRSHVIDDLFDHIFTLIKGKAA